MPNARIISLIASTLSSCVLGFIVSRLGVWLWLRRLGYASMGISSGAENERYCAFPIQAGINQIFGAYSYWFLALGFQVIFSEIIEILHSIFI
jgi:hypothetical protein